MRFPLPVVMQTVVPLLLAVAKLAAADPSPAPPRSAGKAKQVVLVVWDGLRPDSINDTDTPRLARLAREGVVFTRHHPVYPSSTEVNGTAMATGCYPGRSGLIGNREFRPVLYPLSTFPTESVRSIRKGDEVTGDKYLLVPTLPELLHAAARRTLVTGTKPVVLLMDRAARPDRAVTDDFDAQSVVVYEGRSSPPGFLASVPHGSEEKDFSTEIHFPNVEQDAWTTHTLVGKLWNLWLAGPPSFSVLWLSEPDYTQHQFGPDSPQARRALASSDANLGVVLDRLSQRHDTDIFVVSDHGFSTIGRPVDAAKLLTDAGFNAAREYKTPPKPGDILVNGLGGSVYLYVAGHDAETIRRVVAFLQGSDFAGVIFTRDALPGTFGLGVAHIDSPDAPDVAVALRWTDEKNGAGFPGMVTSDGGRKVGQGTHASLSRYDMHNTLVAAGPDFRVGWRDELPTGNVDLAPTIAYLLGLSDLPKMDGRVLSEAFNDLDVTLSLGTPRRTEATHETDKGNWTQYLQVSHYGGVDYIDEGNGATEPKPAP